MCKKISTRCSRNAKSDVIRRHFKVSALISGKDFFRVFSSGKLASCDLHFTGVRRTTWFRTRLSFLCQNTLLNTRYRIIVMSKDLLDYPFCHDVNKYERMVKIGQGTFGFVDCSVRHF